MSENSYTCDCHAVHRELVEKALAHMPEEAVFGRLSEFFKILGDPTRCRLIFALLQSEMCVCDLANVLSMTKSAVSHQLAKMRETGVVKCRREGKEAYYSLDDDHVAEIFSVTMTHLRHREREHETEN